MLFENSISIKPRQSFKWLKIVPDIRFQEEFILEILDS